MGIADVEIKFHYVGKPAPSKVLYLKPRACENIALCALRTARKSNLLISAFPVDSTSLFPNSPQP